MKGAASGNSFYHVEARKNSAKMMWKGSQHWLGVGPDDLLTFYLQYFAPHNMFKYLLTQS